MEQRTCGAMLKQINDEMEKNANHLLKSQDLTMSQVGILLALNVAENHQLSLKEIEHIIHVAQSTAVGIVKRLKQKGFVECFGSLEDKRIKIVRITSLGMECCQVAEKGMQQAEEQLLYGLTETEKDIFKSLLVKIHDNIK